MVLVDKTLDQVLAEINYKEGTDTYICHEVITQRDQLGWIWVYRTTQFEPTIKANADPKADLDPIFDTRYWGHPVKLIMENSFYHGYDCEAGKEILVKFYFASGGLVIQFQDFGSGFDAEEGTSATIENRRDKGTHFKYQGAGFICLMLPEIEAFVTSSRTAETGTTVTIMLKYS